MGEAAIDGIMLFGGGGHAAAVVDVLRRRGIPVACVVDPAGTSLDGIDVVVDESHALDALTSGASVLVAIGDNRQRGAICERIVHHGGRLVSIAAVTATMGFAARIGDGTVVLEHAHVGPRAVIGTAGIVNTAAVVEHDVVLGHEVHVAPGAVLGGGVRCGDDVLVGSGAVVLPGLQLGTGSRVGAGAVVTRDVAPGSTVVGNPARERGDQGRH